MSGEILAFEIFAAKDSDALMMSVPCKCGLKDADTLRIEGLTMFALRERSILAIDFAALTEAGKNKLARLANSGKTLPVGEFTARGLFDAYFLKVIID